VDIVSEAKKAGSLSIDHVGGALSVMINMAMSIPNVRTCSGHKASMSI
jgi:hypothetical protein